MRWAIDRSGSLIEASDFIVYSGPFTCPTCGASVYHRRGFERQAHFSHYHMGINWRCEAYFPSAGCGSEGGQRGEATVAIDRQRSIFASDSYAGARLCVERAEARHSRLMLRLPAEWAIPSASPIVIEFKSGRRQIRAEGGATRKFVRVPWSVPIGKCLADEKELAKEIDAALSSLRYVGNFFSSSVGRGFLLGAEEPLELGRTYWLIAQRIPALGKLPRSVPVDEFDGPTVGWRKVRISLPAGGLSLSDLERIEDVLGRQVSAAKQRPRVTSPIPSRFAPDGVHVYGAHTEEVTIEWNADGKVTIERNGDEIVVEEVPPSFRFGPAKIGEYTVKSNGIAVLAFRVEETESFRPRGVQLHDGQAAYELFELDELPKRQTMKPVVLRLPASRLWQTGKINGKALNPVPDNEWLIPEWVHDLDFGMFGYLRAPSLDEHASESLDHTHTRRAYLFGMAYRHGGAAAACDLSTLKTAGECVRWAKEHRLEWLLPQLIREPRHGEGR